MKKLIFILFAIIIYIINISASVTDIPKYDDAVYPEVAKTIEQTGKALLRTGLGAEYFSSFYTKDDFVYENGIIKLNTAWNLPFYVHCLGLIYKILPNNFIFLRLFGVLCTLITLLLLYFISKEIFDKNKSKFIFYLTGILFLVNPLIIQKSLQLTTDTSILPVLMTLFLYVFIKTYKSNKIKYLILLSVIFSLALWAKLTLPPFLIASIFIFYFLNRKYKKAFFDSFFIFFLGLILTIITWTIFSYLTNTSIFQPLTHTLFLRALSSPGNIFDILKHIGHSIYDIIFASLPFFILFILATFKRIKNYFKTKQLNKIDLLIIYIIITWLAYMIKAPAIYYKLSLYIVSILIISDYLYKSKIFKMKKIDFYYYSIITILLIIYFSFLKDPLLLLSKILPLNPNSVPIIFYLFIYFIPIFIVPLLLLKRKIKFFKIFILSLFILLISMNIGLDIKQSFADYTTIEIYGEKGFRETMNYIKANANKNDILITLWDIAYNTNHKLYYSIGWLTKKNLAGQLRPKREEIVNNIFKNNISFIIYSDFFSEITGGFSEQAKDIILKDYILVKQFDNYYIFKLK